MSLAFLLGGSERLPGREKHSSRGRVPSANVTLFTPREKYDLDDEDEEWRMAEAPRAENGFSSQLLSRWWWVRSSFIFSTTTTTSAVAAAMAAPSEVSQREANPGVDVDAGVVQEGISGVGIDIGDCESRLFSSVDKSERPREREGRTA